MPSRTVRTATTSGLCSMSPKPARARIASTVTYPASANNAMPMARTVGCSQRSGPLLVNCHVTATAENKIAVLIGAPRRRIPEPRRPGRCAGLCTSSPVGSDQRAKKFR